MILQNIMMNTVLTIIFVYLNNQSLVNGFEETFVSLATLFGLIVIVANATFISIWSTNQHPKKQK